MGTDDDFIIVKNDNSLEPDGEPVDEIPNDYNEDDYSIYDN